MQKTWPHFFLHFPQHNFPAILSSFTPPTQKMDIQKKSFKIHYNFFPCPAKLCTLFFCCVGKKREKNGGVMVYYTVYMAHIKYVHKETGSKWKHFFLFRLFLSKIASSLTITYYVFHRMKPTHI